MKSLCIKTNNSNTLNYLLELFHQIDLDNVYFSSHCFKHYKNIIIHYKGEDAQAFYSKLSSILSFTLIHSMEESILKNLIFTNYFYFDSLERKQILELCFDLLVKENEFSFLDRENLLWEHFYEYITQQKQIVLDGFIRFRLKDYYTFLNTVIDTAVNQFIIEREYMEFISLLKLYINSQVSQTNLVHLVYQNTQSILFDENQMIIPIDDHSFDAKYLSDISFSSNDFALNTLLNLIPQKIQIHLLDSTIDEFIHTLQMVFENRIEICVDCSICQSYKEEHKLLQKK